jgi:hypothetical protein
MFRENSLQDCLFGLVGYRQNQNPDYPTLPATITATSSGLYIQDQHPLLSLENIDQGLKNYDSFNYPAYVALTAYVIGDKVRAANGKVYECIDDSTGNEPSASPLFWEEVPLLAQKLEAVHRSAISKVANEVFLQKKLNEVTKTLMENVQLFDGAGSLKDKEIKLSRFVGYQVMVENHRDIVTVIRRIGFQFTQANPEFTLYIYHTSQEDPIYTIDLNLTKVNSFEWKTITSEGQEVLLSYLGDYAPGGAFYIGYYEDDLVGQAINRGYSFSVSPTPCNCNRWYELYTSWSRFVKVVPITVSAASLADILPSDPGGAKLWDYGSAIPVYEKSFGLNLDLTVKCDVTDFMCREKSLFTQAIVKQIAVDLLREIAFSSRNNVIAKETRDLAMYELNNKEGNGLAFQLSSAIKALSFDLSNLNEACLPHDNNKASGISWGAI